MSLSSISNRFEESPQVRKLGEAISHSQNTAIEGLTGSALSFVLSGVFKSSETPFLLLLNDKEEAAYYLNDLEQLVGEQDVLFYPGSYRRPYQIEETDNANVLLRAEVLNRINSRKKPAIIVTYPDALFEKVVTRKQLDKNTLKVKLNDTLSLDFLNEVLFEYQFKRVDFVTEPGEFSVRGGIVDVFSFSHEEPYRIEFFGDEVDSIRTFDVETQLSNDKVKRITIIPNVENKFLQETRESFLKYISPKTVIFSRNLDLVYGRIDSFFEKAEDSFSNLQGELKHAKPEELFANSTLLKNQLQEFTLFQIGGEALEQVQVDTVSFNTKPQPSFNKKFDLLIENLNENHEAGLTNFIFCASEQQAKRFHDIFEDVEEEVHYQTLGFPALPGVFGPRFKTCLLYRPSNL